MLLGPQFTWAIILGFSKQLRYFYFKQQGKSIITCMHSILFLAPTSGTSDGTLHCPLTKVKGAIVPGHSAAWTAALEAPVGPFVIRQAGEIINRQQQAAQSDLGDCARFLSFLLPSNKIRHVLSQRSFANSAGTA